MGKKLSSFTIISSITSWILIALVYVLMNVTPESVAFAKKVQLLSIRFSAWLFAGRVEVLPYLKDGISSIANSFDLGKKLMEKLSPEGSLDMTISDVAGYCVGFDLAVCRESVNYRYAGYGLIFFQLLAFVCAMTACYFVQHHWSSGLKHGGKFKSDYLQKAKLLFTSSTLLALFGFAIHTFFLSKLLSAVSSLTNVLDSKSGLDPGFHYGWFGMLTLSILTATPLIFMAMQGNFQEYDPDVAAHKKKNEDGPAMVEHARARAY